ncbi:MAG: hypothetical protein RI930_223 [Pseudomonadota bacterium]|jgi:hypothetical protein
MKILFMAIWKFKWVFIFFGMFLWSDDNYDKTICAMFTGFSALEIKIESLFIKYFGERK